MRECTSISKRAPILLLLLLPFALALPAHADPSEPKKSGLEDEIDNSPYTRYGEFNEEKEEAEATRFFQSGRLFAIALGMGSEGASGNRGVLWQGGFPLVDFKVQYWFDFNFALALGLMTAPHRYTKESPAVDKVAVTFTRLGLDLKYYFNTRDASAPITFANPYILGAFGSFTKAEASQTTGLPTTDSHAGFGAGAGLEFTISPRKTYFYLEGKVSSVTFKDTFTGDYATPTARPNLPDLTGYFYTFAGGLMFSW